MVYRIFVKMRAGSQAVTLPSLAASSPPAETLKILVRKMFFYAPFPYLQRIHFSTP